MRKIIYSLCFLLTAPWLMAQNPTPPLATQKPKELLTHGHKRLDPYYWLNERDNKEVTDYLRAENAYTEAVMAPTTALKDQIFEEIKGRIKATDASVPYLLDGYYYYNRFEEGKEYPIYCRKKGSLQGKEEILLDVNELAKGKDYCSVVGLSVSDNNELLAFGIDVVGRRKYTIQFKNLRTGQILNTSIPLTNGNVAWSQDSKYVFYTTKDEQTLRSDKVFRHEVGTDAQKDALVYEEKDETFFVYITRTKSKGYILAGSSSTLTDEILYLDAKNPKGDFKVFAPRQKGVKYSIDHYKDKFYIVTNWKAINFRLMESSLTKTDYASWKESLPYDERVYLQDIEIFNDFLVLKERKNGLDALRIIRWKDRQSHYVDFGEPTYSAGLSANLDFNTKVLRYVFASPLTPASTFDYDMDKRSRKLLKQQEVVGGFKAEDYATEYVFATARDGVKVPISIIYKKGLQKNGAAPCLLYGYGSYGAPMSASFRYATLSLLDRGFVYAIAHIRGGSEMGRQWYEDGKMFQKKNTFYDFIDCAEYLVKERYTQPEKLFAKGGSAGGLLIGAVANMRPDLFKGLIANVPFVDVMTTMLDESIPLTTFEYDEWGNPNDINSYIYMLSYSPYDNVEKKAYPHLLVTTGFHDSQVQYFEPAKWVARLRTMKTDQNLLLFKTDMEAGHSGKTGRFQAIKDTAFEYAFLLKLAGMAAK